MSFPLPFSPGAFLPESLMSKTTSKINTTQLPLDLKPTIIHDSSSSPDEISRILASLKPAPVKRSPAKRSEQDPPGSKYPYVTQFCVNGGHQGSVALSFRGTLLPGCRGEYPLYPKVVTCTCYCHKYTLPDATTPSIPPETMIMGSIIAAGPVTVDASPVKPPVTDPDDGPEFNPSESAYDRLLNNKVMTLGPRVRNLVLKHLDREVTREMLNEPYVVRRRGELDCNVEAICRLWLDKALPWDMLTTDVIAVLIDVDNPPSPGAVHAVLTRWDDENFAIVKKNPVRFECFTPTVQEIGIEAARIVARRKSKARDRGLKT
jgi:hypothetical protein